ncbi:Sodium/calcium exchanger protein-domain-containing protein [Mycotypha africana]|uniref:Sodium/calcium exchanger protein-domain-containing protein n=1 Tax=Mycotypha africana TaxID=64632 RepID=UPI002301A035|nr:Sodium/calcium exchanger protein-domain-containing protein [Mycotypha africana]KAI8988316.1 Sodium/calcium exchanger protein-domain-containing protein [Mycotypha africana]
MFSKSVFFVFVLFIFPLIVSSSLLIPITQASQHRKQCSNIESHEDQCAFVMTACHGFSGVFLRFYYCSNLWKPFSLALMLSGLLLLFGAVSTVAADFFCPNLQTISSRLQLSESMAGVTVLAFGNGSPDLFSTFTAMNSGSGSLAIGELIGAAFFIVSVVSGCMGIIRPFRSKRITFMRDATFLTGAIMIMTWIVYHQRICWYHGLILICYYLTYVIVVVMGAYRFPGAETPALPEPKSISIDHNETGELLSETSRLLQSNPVDGYSKPLRLDIPAQGFQQEHLGHVIRPVSPNSSFISRRSSLHMDSYVPRTTSTNGSISSRLYRRAMTPRIGMRASLFSAIEFQEQITSIKRANSTQIYRNRRLSGGLRQGHSQTSVPCMSTAVDNRQQNDADQLHAVFPYSHQQHLYLGRSPDNYNNGAVNDYFTYISANQQLPTNGTGTAATNVSSPQRNDTLNKNSIPEIRLAPPAATTDYPQHQKKPQNDLEEANVDDDDSGIEGVPRQQALKRSISFSIILDDICSTLFPTLQEWESKTAMAKLSAVVAVPLVLVFTLTLPIAEGNEVKVDDIEVSDSMMPLTDDNDDDDDDSSLNAPRVIVEVTSAGDDVPTSITRSGFEGGTTSKTFLTVPTSERSIFELNTEDGDLPLLIEEEDPTPFGWCRWLVSIQAIFATTFVTIVMALNGYIPSPGVFVGFLIGCMLACLVLVKTKANEAPKWYWMLSFVGFVIALNWIFLIANEMVGLLQALGAIFNISEAIMGLTIFALGNSVGDLVANTAIAKMGFPTMAISACYADMVLGVGISSTYQTWITGVPYQLDIAPTILISSSGLIIVLLSTLIAVNINGYHINRQLGWWMIIVYLTCTVVNVLLEFHVFY